MTKTNETQPVKTIWCLFGVENNYDQPDNNLLVWWSEKPSIEKILHHFNLHWDSVSDENIVKMVELYRGEHVRIDDTTYRIQIVEEGKVI